MVNALFACALSALITTHHQYSDEPVVVVGEQPPQIAPVSPVPQPTPTPQPPSPPRITLNCSPPMGVVGPYGRLPVLATLLVANPDEQLWCPNVEWEVNDEPQGSHQPFTCKPYAEAIAEAGGDGLAPWSEKRTFGLQGGGYSYKIRVKLKQGKKTVLFRECQVSVR